MIWRAIEHLARHKPVVVSIGSIAASGGYYIAAPAREIFAEPSSLTGSIGIFFGKVDFSSLLSMLHIGVELDRRGDHADMESLFRPSTHDEITLAGRMIAEFYDLFLRRVAAGRHTTPSAVDAIGQGRVFSGVRGTTLGLVDHVGSLGAAIDRARALANLSPDSEIVDLPNEPEGLLEQLVSLVTGGGSSAASSPVALLLARPEIRATVEWLLAVAYAGRTGSHVLALTEWPLANP
jgi:protease-4